MKSESLASQSRQIRWYALGTLIRPGATLEKLVAEPMPMLYGSMAILMVGVLYTITTGIGYLNGFGAYTLPFLPFAAKESAAQWRIHFITRGTLLFESHRRLSPYGPDVLG